MNYYLSVKKLGVVKGPQPLNFNPALTACTSKRMKTVGFSSLRVLPPGNERERQNPKKTRKSGL
jgi:hypothetical protein